MLSPNDYLNNFNFNGQLSLPPFAPYNLLTLNNSLSVDNVPCCQDKKTTPILDTGVVPDGSGTLDASKVGNNFFDVGGWLNLYFKDMALISLALVLLILGLYMLAMSTKTGQETFSAAVKAAAA